MCSTHTFRVDSTLTHETFQVIQLWLNSTINFSGLTQLRLNSNPKFASMTQLRLDSFESESNLSQIWVKSDSRLITFYLIWPKLVPPRGGAVECSYRLVLSLKHYQYTQNLNLFSSDNLVTQLWLKQFSVETTNNSDSNDSSVIQLWFDSYPWFSQPTQLWLDLFESEASQIWLTIHDSSTTLVRTDVFNLRHRTCSWWKDIFEFFFISFCQLPHRWGRPLNQSGTGTYGGSGRLVRGWQLLTAGLSGSSGTGTHGGSKRLVRDWYSQRVWAARQGRSAGTPARCRAASGEARSEAGRTWPEYRPQSAPHPPPGRSRGRGSAADYPPSPRRQAANLLETVWQSVRQGGYAVTTSQVRFFGSVFFPDEHMMTYEPPLESPTLLSQVKSIIRSEGRQVGSGTYLCW